MLYNSFARDHQREKLQDKQGLYVLFLITVCESTNKLSPNKQFNGFLSGKESTCNAGDAGSIPGSGKSPGEGNGKPLQYSYLRNPADRGAWPAIVHGVTKSRTGLSD